MDQGRLDGVDVAVRTDRDDNGYGPSDEGLGKGPPEPLLRAARGAADGVVAQAQAPARGRGEDPTQPGGLSTLALLESLHLTL